MGGLLSEFCGVEDVEWIALGSAERVVVGRFSAAVIKDNGIVDDAIHCLFDGAAG
jgi:hypothetical protein